MCREARGALLEQLFEKHGTPESHELGQAQFAGLLRDMLADLAESLARNPVITVRPGLDPGRWTKTEVLEEVSCLTSVVYILMHIS